MACGFTGRGVEICALIGARSLWLVAYVRTVKTVSGAMAVQIVWSSRRGSRSIEHLGPARDDEELEALDELVVGLGATRAEQHEFAECLERVAETVTCDGVHSPTGKSCVRSQLHKGTHRAADGTQWLDEDLIRRPPTEPATTPMTQRLDKLRATHLKVRGPHW